MPGEPLLAGVDVGTTRVKAALYDTRGRAVASAAVPTPTRPLGPGRAEHDAEALWDAAVAALRQALDDVADPGRIASVAVASMAEAGVPLDASGEPTAPVIAWFDRRAEPQARRLAEAIGAVRLRTLTGVPPQPIYGVCKLAWLADHRPDAFARARVWLNIADYIAYRLSGVHATDLSLATRTGALDLRARAWSREVLAAAGVPRPLLAPLVASGTALGGVTREAARVTGLAEHTVVGAGGHDHICGALAAGVVDPGRALDSIGTAESVLVPLTAPLPTGEDAPRYSQGVHVAAGRWYASTGVHAGGASIDWVTGLVAGRADRAGLLAEAATVPIGAHGVVFAPHVHLPGVTDGAQGALAGLTPDTSGPVIVRAVLEGLAVAACDVLHRLVAQAAHPAAPEVRVIGGGARNALLLAIKAAVGGRSLRRPDLTEATALGAALLGGVAAGVFNDTHAAAAAVAADLDEVTPADEDVAAYAAVAARVRALSCLQRAAPGR
ncbi:MAG TPA: FGGY family carbohydrate kinase [Egibacteraceae bacterium]|nr:FGGY family carbohydrate kinase [Egibacteraceae bacterium]